MSTHTPGPWKVYTQPEGTVVWLNGSAGYELRDPNGFGHKANPADARLIAAAPDLLEAAKEVLDFRSWIVSACPPEIRTAVRSVFTPLADAIAKAEETPENKTP